KKKKNPTFTSWQQRPYLFRFRHNRPLTSDMDHMRQDCTFIPIKDDNDEVEYVCIVVNDVTENCIFQGQLQQALKQVQAMSVTDALTGLYNRRHLETVLGQEFKRARRHKRPLSVLLFDIDFFKKVNDTYGHRAGDTVLQSVARLCQEMLREHDVCARYGGEEFCLVLPDTDLEGACVVAERLRKSVKQERIEVDGNEISVTITIGVCDYDDTMPHHEAMLDSADEALYEGKEQGRDRVIS
ncbi:diguanylate cyclase, partial [Natronospira sp.]|uniref:GGDEF domain-containing protein n=1 Tax=Natronospira sp. TaxID=2024970 RepID=UPI003872C351